MNIINGQNTDNQGIEDLALRAFNARAVEVSKSIMPDKIGCMRREIKPVICEDKTARSSASKQDTAEQKFATAVHRMLYNRKAYDGLLIKNANHEEFNKEVSQKAAIQLSSRRAKMEKFLDIIRAKRDGKNT